MLNRYLSQVPDDTIPELAHSIIDKAIADGGLTLLEGKVVIDLDDLKEMKQLLDYNLPLTESSSYDVKVCL